MRPAQGVLSHSIPAGAEAQWERLIASAAAAPEVVPCAGHGWPYWHGDDEEQDVAARACLECPVMVLCGEYADAAGERWGVWGGRTERERQAKGTDR